MFFKKAVIAFFLSASVLLMCGCTENTVIAFENGFAADIKITAAEKTYSYYLTYTVDKSAVFSACENTYMGYSFSENQNKVIYGDYCVNVNSRTIENNLCRKIWKILNSAIGKTAAPDYNNVYCIHGVSDGVEYKLFLNRNGIPQKTVFDGQDTVVQYFIKEK